MDTPIPSAKRIRRAARPRRKNLKYRMYDHTTDSVMIRGLDGSIHFWNRAAERDYGWSQGEAIGNVSHHLLSTVFPCPLAEINDHLVEHGFWEGELIHTLNTGERIKVQSRWELKGDSIQDASEVIEINKVAQVVQPETAHLIPRRALSERALLFLWSQRFWWLTPLIVCLVAGWAVLEFTQPQEIIPLPD